MNKEFEYTLLGLTVWGEARSETLQGKLAVAWVVRNRMDRQNLKVSQVVLKPSQFSFWNTDDPNRPKISTIDEDDPVWKECMTAAIVAHDRMVPDPTKGAEFYMNVDLVKRQRGGTLPKWWGIDADADGEVKIGDHTFRRRKQ